MEKSIFFVFILLFLIGCGNEHNKNLQTEKKEASQGISVNSKSINPNQQETYRKFQKTVFCDSIQFEVSSNNGETSTLHVTCDDLQIRKYDNSFKVEGQLIYAFGTDQNEDGFCELYLVVQKNDGSGNLEIIGIASFNDKSAGEITVKDVNLPRQKNSDKVYVYYEKLKREFHDESGKLHVYNYNLVKSEAGYILEAERYK